MMKKRLNSVTKNEECASNL